MISAGGEILWAQRYGDASDQCLGTSTTWPSCAASVAFDLSGNLIIAGKLKGKLSFGANAEVKDGTIFVAKLDPAGVGQWAVDASASGFLSYQRLAVTAAGDITISGNFIGKLAFGSTVEATSLAAFVSKVDPGGAPQWTRAFGGDVGSFAQVTSLTTGDNIFLAGEFKGSPFLIGSDYHSPTGTDIFFVELSGKGKIVWAETVGDEGDNFVHGLTVAADGTLSAAVSFSDDLDLTPLGGGLQTHSDGSDRLIVQFSASGKLIFTEVVQQSVSPAQSKRYHGLARHDSGDLVFLGTYSNTFGIGGDNHSSAGELDVAVAKLSANGELLWSRSFGDPANQEGWSVAVDSKGATILAGQFGGAIDFGNKPLMYQGAYDVFVAKLAP